MRLRPFAAPLVLLALLAAGCGATGAEDTSDDFRGEQRRVASVVEDLQSDAADGDGAAICRDVLTRALAERMARAGRSCAAAVEAAIDDADTFELAVRTVRIQGDRATAAVRLETGDRDRTTRLQLVRERGGWRIAELPA